jgi:hypothetical protein
MELNPNRAIFVQYSYRYENAQRRVKRIISTRWINRKLPVEQSIDGLSDISFRCTQHRIQQTSFSFFAQPKSINDVDKVAIWLTELFFFLGGGAGQTDNEHTTGCNSSEESEQ